MSFFCTYTLYKYLNYIIQIPDTVKGIRNEFRTVFTSVSKILSYQKSNFNYDKKLNRQRHQITKEFVV